MISPLKIGFGASSITPPLPCRFAGYVRRDGLSRQVARPLWARSLALDNGEIQLGWTICDLVGADRRLVADIRTAIANQAGLPPGKVMVSATHTHAGPDLLMDWSDGEGDYSDLQASYRSFLPRAIASSMVAAVEEMSPAVLRWGERTVSGVAGNRRDSAGRSGALGVLAAAEDGLDGHLKGMVVVYPCHGTVLGPNNHAVSGDVIGAGVEALERSTGLDGRCAWTQGAAGDVSTRAYRRERTQREADRLGGLVASAAREAAASAAAVSGQTALGIETTEVSLPLKPNEAVRNPQVSVTNRSEDDRSDAALLEEALAAREHRRGLAPEEVAEVSVMQIGELHLAFVPGEPFGSLERELMQRAGVPFIRMIGYSNGAPGYVFGPDDDGGYEVLSSPLSADAGPRIVEAAVDLATRK